MDTSRTVIDDGVCYEVIWNGSAVERDADLLRPVEWDSPKGPVCSACETDEARKKRDGRRRRWLERRKGPSRLQVHRTEQEYRAMRERLVAS